MALASKLLLRLALLVGAITMFGLDANDAFAQSRNCQALANTLQQIEANGSFQGLQDSNDQLRQAQDAVTAAESRYVRDGCNAMAKAHQPLSPMCQGEARDVLSARATLKQISGQADTGNAVAQQREAILQEMARFNCGGSPGAQPRQTRGNLFDQLFGQFENDFGNGGDGVSTRGDEFSGEAGYDTIRTVCVRKADGYYWPISFSTTMDYVQQDLQTCQAQCPGLDVDLYYYQNPGQQPEDMVNLEGAPYKSLPTAFAYRTTYNPDITCKPKIDYGTINLAATPDGGSRAMIAYEGNIFPLPMRDPRRPTDATVVSVSAKTYVDIPLPRPRPAAPGEAPKPVVVQQATRANTDRIVMYGDKRVRLVGPDTTYVQAAGAGT
ncbi:MAG: DUF2865 domain-containing protein [Devosia sp.]